MDNLHIDRNGTVPEPPGSDLTIILVNGGFIGPVGWDEVRAGAPPSRTRPGSNSWCCTRDAAPSR